VDAYYDTQLNITWLANFNTNAANGNGGLMDWNTANTWATTTSFFGLSGWRLPTVNDTGTPGCDFAYSGTDCGWNVQTSAGNTVNSEMAHLYYVTLGNLALNDANGLYLAVGGLINATLLVACTQFDSGGQLDCLDYGVTYAVAVRPGDVVASVPVPSTAALLVAFGSMALSRHKKTA
jgi:hypothetical protein